MRTKRVSAEGSQPGIKICRDERKRREMRLEIPSYFMGIRGKWWCFWGLAGLGSLRPCSVWSVRPLRCPPPRKLRLG